MTVRGPVFILALLAASVGFARPPVYCGNEAVLDIVSSDAGLTPRFISPDAPLQVSILSRTAESDRTRYVIRLISSAPGHFDLRDHINSSTGQPSDLTDDDAIVEVLELSPTTSSALQVSAPRPQISQTWRNGLALAALAWVAALVGIFVRRTKPRTTAAVVEPPRAVSEIEQFDALVLRLQRDDLGTADRRLLERFARRLGRRRFGRRANGPMAVIERWQYHPASADAQAVVAAAGQLRDTSRPTEEGAS